ncbi:PREDICTED: tripartite motif-containing protein 3-like [Branchiostoma belcheri]|uniref:RING-type E3 ubiquitin transferase n=1 Tax=Branchiostoma belcheri TaxID=7741 RepID=A0A6P4YBM5_BRABE|nr:PREDICTED: tripartite motif-containing protein 3-like [Branchiostoma belcheri]
MAAALLSLGTHFKEELSCSICLELFTRPKMLPCQHTFCQDCLQDHAGRGGTFQCPICRRQVRLPPLGVAGLPDNLMAANMCERLKQQTTMMAETREQPKSDNWCCSSHPSKPTDTAVPVLGHVTVQSLPSAPIPAALYTSLHGAASGTGHHHGNQREHQPQKVTFGGWGSETGQFMNPLGVAVSDEGEIFVADGRNQRIQVFTLQGTFIRLLETVVSGEEKISPDDVAMGGEGNLWVVGSTDDSADFEFAVQYTKQGRVLSKFDLQKTRWVRGVAVDTRRNHILITQTTGDWHNRKGEVLVFRPDGTLVRTVGGKRKSLLVSLLSSRQQGMKFPQYITVDRQGNILVSDQDNNCVHVYSEDGQFLFQFGSEGSCEGQLNNPRGICTDRAGNIIVVDRGNSRVEMFDKTGKFLKHIATDINRPLAVAMATQGQLVITDYGDQKVSIFQNI